MPRTPRTLLLAVAAAVCTPALVCTHALGDERPLSEVVCDPARLAETDGLFAVRMNGQVAGGGSIASDATMELSTTCDGDKVVMEDELNYAGRTMRHESVCEARGSLRPESGAVSFSKGDRVIESTYVVDHDTQVVLAGGRQTEREMPFGVVTQQALLRMICQLPADAGDVYTFTAYAETFDGGVTEPVDGQVFSVVCLGPDEVETEHGTAPATRYDVNAGRQWSAWVGENGALLRIEADAGATVMTRVDEDTFARMNDAG